MLALSLVWGFQGSRLRRMGSTSRLNLVDRGVAGNEFSALGGHYDLGGLLVNPHARQLRRKAYFSMLLALSPQNHGLNRLRYNLNSSTEASKLSSIYCSLSRDGGGLHIGVS